MSAGTVGGATRWWLALGVVGLASRFVLAGLSDGSNDVSIWTVFAQYISNAGLTQTYLDLDGRPGSPVPVFNHPALPALWLSACWKLAQAMGWRFSILLKAAGLVAECASAFLIWKIWLKRAGPEVAAKAVAGFGLALSSILVSGYHGNTDAVYAFLVLLAAYQLEQGRPFVAGAVLAGAVNIKLIPVFAVPALVLALRDWRSFFRFSAGLALAVVPFIPHLVMIPAQLIKSVFAYTPNLEHWGLVGLLLVSAGTRRLAQAVPSAIEAYVATYRYVLLLGIGGMALWARRKHAPVLESVLVGLCLFMILTPGFGVQYTALLGPIMFAVSYRWGIAWTAVAGAFIFVPYFVFIEGGLPWHSTFTSRYPMPAPLFGFLAWVLLIQLVISVVRAWRAPAAS